MRYDEAANFLLDLQRLKPKAGTASTADLLAHLGVSVSGTSGGPTDESVDGSHEGPTYVQVAGSNGKGSTARMVERVLREAGLDVGLYTSPHFDDLRERVQVNGRTIPESAVAEFVAAIEDHVTERGAAGDSPTFFETMTAMGLWYFDREGVDVAVLEVGIGGRYDATSVVDPTASAVTSVSLEHTSVIGDTVEEIARDKAHVVSSRNPLVTATTGDALDAVKGHAGDVVRVGTDDDADVRVEYGGRANHAEAGVTLDGPDWYVEARIPMLGDYQAENAGVAAVLARQVESDVDEETLARGLRKATWPGRFEVMGTDPLTVLDGAHNPAACESVAETLAEFDGEFDDLYLVFGGMHDKDLREMVEALPTPDHAFTAVPDVERAEEKEVLARVLRNAGVDDVQTVSSVETAVDRALVEAGPEDAVLVTGSLYVVAEARTRWTRVDHVKDVDDLDDAREVLEETHVSPPGVWRMRGKGVHRVVKTRLQKRQAQFVKEELLSLGGECALSGLNDQSRIRLDVVMMGTLAQFKRLCGKLDGQPYGLSVFADELRETLEIGLESVEHGYPWEGDRTAVMGILNVTPDSFHDGGQYQAIEDAVTRAGEMVEAGADIIDVGGESTRPGAEPVPVAEEKQRVLPVVERIDEEYGEDVLVSIDTRKAAVGRAALEAGADILNDVTGLEDPEMRFVAAEHDVPIVVMHSINAPVEPGREVEYDDVVEDVVDELRERVLLAEKAGLDREKIIVDPGIGFGKSIDENFEVLDRTDEFHALGCPVLVGHSHKSMFGKVDRYPDEGGYATVAGTALAADRGADIVRVHDVEENVAAVRTVEATREGTSGDDTE